MDLMVIDAVPDPDPPVGYTVCIQGPNKDEPPRNRLRVAGRFRRWMVDAEWLDDLAHKRYDTMKRISGNGKAWGDAVDPEDEEIAKRELNDLGESKRM
jgi:hypothetical protein